MIIIDEETPLSESVKNIFTTNKSIEVCENYTGSSSSALQAIQGYSDSRRILEGTSSEEIAKTAHIINQSVSLIALESDKQRNDLERYSQGSDKYDTNYENFSNENNTPQSLSRRSDLFARDSISAGAPSNDLFGAQKVSTNSSMNDSSSW